jgi:uncharacterized membrane protein
MTEPNEFKLKEMHDDPKNWKLGVFYYNRNDERLFPPKRFYGGWTVNFANYYSILAMLAVVVLIMIIALVFNRSFH